MLFWLALLARQPQRLQDPPSSSCTPIANTSFDGNDLTSIAASDPSACCGLCRQTFDCDAYTHYDGVCYLKSNATNRVQCDGCTSGLLPGVAQCLKVPGASFDGNDLGHETVDSPDECCARCNSTAACVAYTHYQGECYYKSTAASRVTCDGCSSGVLSARAPLPPVWPMAGMTFTGGRYCPNVSLDSAAGTTSMQRLASTGATWVAIVVTQYQYFVNSTEIFPLYNATQELDPERYYVFVTLREEEVRGAIRTAKSLGLKVLLKPHVDLLRSEKGTPSHDGTYWRGDIGGCYPKDEFDAPFTQAQWSEWFASYARMFVPYAELAAAEGVEMLSINTELYCPSRQEAGWRDVVAQARRVYDGRLTVSAINGREGEISWWHAVDVIGVDAYWSLDGSALPELVGSWQPHVSSLRALSTRFGGMPVALTEIGYCSGQCSRDHTPSAADYAAHKTHYEAVFEAFRGSEAWFQGAFWWNWVSDPGAFAKDDDCLTPQGKPAEDALRRYYRTAQPKPGFVGDAKCLGAGRCTC